MDLDLPSTDIDLEFDPGNQNRINFMNLTRKAEKIIKEKDTIKIINFPHTLHANIAKLFIKKGKMSSCGIKRAAIFTPKIVSLFIAGERNVWFDTRVIKSVMTCSVRVSSVPKGSKSSLSLVLVLHYKQNPLLLPSV